MSLMQTFLGYGIAFLYQRQIPINTTTTTNLQIRVQLTTTTFDYSKCKSNGSDICFVASYGDNGQVVPLTYWIETWNIAGTSSIWIKIPTSGTREIFMQYGAPGFTTTSSTTMAGIMNVGMRYRYYGAGGVAPVIPSATLDGGGTDPNAPNYGWGSGTGLVNAFGTRIDSFAVIWDGWVVPESSGTHIFYTTSDDGQRLYIADSLVINNWVDQGDTEQSYSYSWTDGVQKKIRYDMYENGGGATAKLGWDPPSATTKAYPIAGTYLKSPTYSISYQDPYNYTGGLSPAVNFNSQGYVTTNMQYYWDAASFAGSYPGSGTTMVDISGLNGTSLSLINSPTFSATNGGSISLTGTNDYLSSATAVTLTNNFTLEGWFNFDAVSGACLFGHGIPSLNTGLHIWFYDGTNLRFGMYSNDYDVAIGGSITPGTWYHFAFTYVHSGLYTKKIYLNGVLQGTSGTMTPYSGTGVLNVGAVYSTAVSIGNGKIGSSKVYNAVLSDAQILQNFNASKTRFGY